jgi:dTDP-4-amino-4,6-dideoxygalactose transaminase
VLRIDFDHFEVDRATVMNRLKAAGIGTQVHYIPVHLQPYYRRHSHTDVGDYPHAEHYYRQALSIPMFPQMTGDDCDRVVDTLSDILAGGA